MLSPQDLAGETGGRHPWVDSDRPDGSVAVRWTTRHVPVALVLDAIQLFGADALLDLIGALVMSRPFC